MEDLNTIIFNFRDDSRYQIEKDAAGRFTITIKLVEQKDQGQWMAKVTDECISKCQVYVEEPRDTFVVPLKSQRATEKEGARLECDVNDPAIEVEWWHDGKKIQIDGKRYIAEKVGRKRRLILPTARIEDQGMSDKFSFKMKHKFRRIQMHNERRQHNGTAYLRWLRHNLIGFNKVRF